MQKPLPFSQPHQASKGQRPTAKLEVGDLILALCEAGEWDLALRMAREVEND